jgi:hypothetical protein
MTAEELLKNIDWSELRNQKRILLNVINDDGHLPNEDPKHDLRGLLYLIDNLQEYACDVLNIPSIDIYDFEDEDDMEKIKLLLNKKRERMESGQTQIPVELKDDISQPSKQLDDFNFNVDDKKLIMSIINNYGTGQHPVCNEETFDYFQIHYVIDTIKEYKEKIYNDLTHEGQVIFNHIKNKLKIV